MAHFSNPSRASRLPFRALLTLGSVALAMLGSAFAGGRAEAQTLSSSNQTIVHNAVYRPSDAVNVTTVGYGYYRYPYYRPRWVYPYRYYPMPYRASYLGWPYATPYPFSRYGAYYGGYTLSLQFGRPFYPYTYRYGVGPYPYGDLFEVDPLVSYPWSTLWEQYYASSREFLPPGDWWASNYAEAVAAEPDYSGCFYW